MFVKFDLVVWDRFRRGEFRGVGVVGSGNW